jgi:hypothetical protein
MPQSSIQRQEFGSKKPYLIAAVFALALVVFVIYVAEKRIGDVLQDRLDKAKAPMAALEKLNQQLKSALAERDQLKKQADQMKDLADTRFSWIQVLTALRGVLMQAESAEKANLVTPDNGGTNTDTGIWVEQFTPVLPNGSTFAAGDESGTSSFGGRRGGGVQRPSRYGRNAGRPAPVAPAAPTGDVGGVNDISEISLVCRGINRGSLSPTANADLAFLVKQGLTNNPAFRDASLVGDLRVDESNTNMFTFSVTLKLTHPFKL